MLSGNYCRDKDRTYLQKLYPELQKGATAKDISKKFNIPHPTAKLVLRNIISGNHVNRRKISNHYIYYIS